MNEKQADEQRWAAEIREANLAYLILAQGLIRDDREQALFRLGVSEEVADVLDALTPAQLLRLASGTQLLCRFRFDDELVWTLLADHARSDEAVQGSARRLHASILMAGNFAEAQV